jgi:hypothetical protein
MAPADFEKSLRAPGMNCLLIVPPIPGFCSNRLWQPFEDRPSWNCSIFYFSVQPAKKVHSNPLGRSPESFCPPFLPQG